jgi:hypothetical protein
LSLAFSGLLALCLEIGGTCVATEKMISDRFEAALATRDTGVALQPFQAAVAEHALDVPHGATRLRLDHRVEQPLQQRWLARLSDSRVFVVEDVRGG